MSKTVNTDSPHFHFSTFIQLTSSTLYTGIPTLLFLCTIQPACGQRNKHFMLAHGALLPAVQYQIIAIFTCKTELSCIIVGMVLLPFPLLFFKMIRPLTIYCLFTFLIIHKSTGKSPP